MKIHKKEGLVSFWNSKAHSNVINAVSDIEGKDTCKNTKQTSTRTNNMHSKVTLIEGCCDLCAIIVGGFKPTLK